MCAVTSPSSSASTMLRTAILTSWVSETHQNPGPASAFEPFPGFQWRGVFVLYVDQHISIKGWPEFVSNLDPISPCFSPSGEWGKLFFSIERERCRRAAMLSLQAIAHIEVRPLEVLVFVADRLRLLFWVSDNRMERIPTEMSLFVKDFFNQKQPLSLQSHQTPFAGIEIESFKFKKGKKKQNKTLQSHPGSPFHCV